jgi:hypothetical protein
MTEDTGTNSSGLSPIVIILIAAVAVFCCICFLCVVATVWVVNSTDFYIGDWQNWYGLIQIFG